MQTPLVQEALIFAAAAHARAGQVRQYTGEPYIVHPIEVMMILKAEGINDPPVLAAALLHDVVEDTPAKAADIAELFGQYVGDLVYFLTNKPNESDADKLHRLANAGAAVHAIKCADIISNATGLVDMDPARAKVYMPKKAAQVDALILAPRALRLRAARATRLP